MFVTLPLPPTATQYPHSPAFAVSLAFDFVIVDPHLGIEISHVTPGAAGPSPRSGAGTSAP